MRTSPNDHQLAIEKLRYCLAILLAFSCQAALASFTDNLSIGNAKALALGHAVTADPPDIDSIHYNPAGLTRLKGRQMVLKGIVGLFSTEMKLGDYGQYTKDLIEKYRLQYEEYNDENGSLAYGKLPYDQYVYDEALNSKSKAEGGPTIMLPGGMVDLPIGAGVAGGATYNPPGSPLTFGTNVYSPMMNGFHREKDDVGRYAQQRVAWTVITYFSPTVAYKVSNELSVGMSLNFNYAGMGMELPIRLPHEAIFWIGSPFVQTNFCNEDGTPKDNPLTGTKIDVCTNLSPYSQFASLNFEADQSDALGYNLGLLWRPITWLSLGLSYNSAIDVNMKGNFDFSAVEPFTTFLANFQRSPGWESIVNTLGAIGVKMPTADQVEKGSRGPMNISYEIPQHLNGGISLQVTPSFKFNLDVRWTDWSAFSTIDMEFNEDIPLLEWGVILDQIGTKGANGFTTHSVKYQLGVKDAIYSGAGVEYQYDDKLVLRAGFENRPSIVPKDRPNAFIPISSGNLYSTGIGYDLDSLRHFDFSIGYFRSEQHFPPCSAQSGNSCNPKNLVYPVYMGQDIRTKVEFLLFELSYQAHF